MNTGKTMGIILIVVGIGICVVSTLVLGAGYLSGNYESIAAPAVGLALAFVIAAPVVGIGAYMLIRGQQEAAEFAEVEKERKLLGMVQTQGQVSIPEVALELDVGRDQVKEWVYDLVDKELFAGYINWDEGMLYSRKAREMKSANKCPNCGGEVELAGKGVVQCPYCGAEIFL